MELIQEEMKEINIEKELNIKFDEADKKERELFTNFCIAIRDSHDKERSQAEYTKYFGIILSIIGTIVGSILTLIVNSVRTKDLLSGIESVIEKLLMNKDEKLEVLTLNVKSLHESMKNYQNKIENTFKYVGTIIPDKQMKSRDSALEMSATQISVGIIVIIIVLKMFGL